MQTVKLLGVVKIFLKRIMTCSVHSHHTVCNYMCRSVALFPDLFPSSLSFSPSPLLLSVFASFCLSPPLPHFLSLLPSLSIFSPPSPLSLLFSCNIFTSERGLIWPKTLPCPSNPGGRVSQLCYTDPGYHRLDQVWNWPDRSHSGKARLKLSWEHCSQKCCLWMERLAADMVSRGMQWLSASSVHYDVGWSKTAFVRLLVYRYTFVDS